MGKIFAGFHSHLQSIRMVVTPLILTTPSVIIWHFLYKYGWHSTSKADEPIVNFLLPAFIGGYFFIATIMMVHESRDIRKMKEAIRGKNKSAFVDIAEDPVPLPMRYVLFVVANVAQAYTTIFIGPALPPFTPWVISWP